MKARAVNITFDEAQFISDFTKAIRPVLARSDCGGLLRKSKSVERTIYLACARARMAEKDFTTTTKTTTSTISGVI
jgi:hypothetical protein